jgi:hypothetical protein
MEDLMPKIKTWKDRVANLGESAAVLVQKRETQQSLAKDIADLANETNEVWSKAQALERFSVELKSTIMDQQLKTNGAQDSLYILRTASGRENTVNILANLVECFGKHCVGSSGQALFQEENKDLLDQVQKIRWNSAGVINVYAKVERWRDRQS